MSGKETLEVRGELLRWARETAGFSIPDAAKKVHLSADKLTAWEAEYGLPTPRQLEHLADVYKRPTATFFLEDPPHEPSPPPDFRTRPSETAGELTSATLFAIRRARRLQNVFQQLSELAVETEPAAAEITLSAEPEHSAQLGRGRLGIAMDQQISWRDQRVALNKWRAAVESTGVLVFQFSFSLSEARGFSLPGVVPAIVLNTKDAPTARIFTLFHEWAHLLLLEPGICIPDERHVSPPRANKVETFCNAFAGNLLVPKAYLEDRFTSPPGALSMQESVSRPANEFSVSRFVILRRLLDLGIVTSAQYQRYSGELNRSAGVQKRKKQSGGPSPAVKVVTQLGATFTSKILGMYNTGLIDPSQVCDYLSVRIKHVSKINALLPYEQRLN
jgi:Zn-dependent peptidase ImmA (M78 family)